MTLPREPQALVAKLVERLGLAGAAEVLRLLALYPGLSSQRQGEADGDGAGPSTTTMFFEQFGGAVGTTSLLELREPLRPVLVHLVVLELLLVPARPDHHRPGHDLAGRLRHPSALPSGQLVIGHRARAATGWEGAAASSLVLAKARTRAAR
jgi:hypothetical protein